MNKEKEIILENNTKEYYSSANDDYNKGRFNSAVIMYFKALVSLYDLYLLRKTGNSPSSHVSRFKIVKENFPELYDTLDRDFPFYQDSYVHSLSKELAEVVRDDVRDMAKKVQVNL